MNYNSVEEILSSGTTNMEVIRNNTPLTNTQTQQITGVNWFTFNGVVADVIYAHAASGLSFGTTSVQLSVCYLVRTCKALYIWREEGTLNFTTHFLKIRWDGYANSRYTTDQYKLTYDVILWDSGDISVHMVSIPTSGTTRAVYSLKSISTYTYTVSATNPDVTFYSNGSEFEISNSVFEPPQQRYLIRSGTIYYTISDNTLIELDNVELNAETFLTYGTSFFQDIALLASLDSPELLCWINKGQTPNSINVIGVPPIPQTIHYAPQNIPDGSTILNINVLCSDDVLFTITFDEGATWKYYNGNAWCTTLSFSDGMLANTIKTISHEAWLDVATSATYQIRCVLPALTSYVSCVAVNYI